MPGIGNRISVDDRINAGDRIIELQHLLYDDFPAALPAVAFAFPSAVKSVIAAHRVIPRHQHQAQLRLPTSTASANDAA